MQTNLSKLVERTRKRLSLLEELQAQFDVDPAFGRILRRTLSQNNGADDNEQSSDRPKHRSPQTQRGVTLFQRTVATFKSNGNAWMTPKQIMEAVGAKSRGAIGVMLYKANAGSFESRDHPAGGRARQWRMKGGELIDKS